MSGVFCYLSYFSIAGIKYPTTHNLKEEDYLSSQFQSMFMGSGLQGRQDGRGLTLWGSGGVARLRVARRQRGGGAGPPLPARPHLLTACSLVRESTDAYCNPRIQSPSRAPYLNTGDLGDILGLNPKNL